MPITKTVRVTAIERATAIEVELEREIERKYLHHQKRTLASDWFSTGF